MKIRTRIRPWVGRLLIKGVNATCNECGYHGIRTDEGPWCSECLKRLGREGGTLMPDQKNRSARRP